MSACCYHQCEAVSKHYQAKKEKEKYNYVSDLILVKILV